MCMSVNDCASALSIDFEATNKFQQVGKFMGTESMNGKSWRYIYYVLDSVSITLCVLLYLILVEILRDRHHFCNNVQIEIK